MLVIQGAEEARRTLLRRAQLDEPELPESVLETVRRVFGAELDAAAVVDRILRDVRREGDAAVRRYNAEIDGYVAAEAAPLEVPADEIERGAALADPAVVSALEFAAGRIRSYHEKQLEHSQRSFEADGLGQIVRPIRCVGLYVPGNVVVYPSTLLMTAVPARVAGVEELVMVTPVDGDGNVSPLKLAAARIAGVDRVFRAGGVQGVAAMAFGTESIPKVDKICGPGGIFVTVAKKKLYGEVGIDGIFGPSETVVVADASADPKLVIADLLAGAEHDELATAVLITDHAELASMVAANIDQEIAAIARSSVIRASLAARGGIVVVASVDEAVDLGSDFAPEHLLLHVADVDRALARVRNAGCVFAGERSVESIGDYTAGPSHVMPTGGSATFASPLGVHDFLKVTSLVRLDQQTVDRIAPAAAAIGYAEGLEGHARAVESRMSRKDGA